MQFNPLFLSETGNTQTLVSKNNKMQSNKYLFSDIVKVVMQDGEGNQKLKNIKIDEKISGELNLTLNPELVTQELQSKIITNSENELMKLQLADILPADMADLLINDDVTITDEKAISFLGKDQLDGELKNFITSLVGEEIIESNVSNDKGLLLRLEDYKSAVNIEVTKELNPKLSSDKIVVQALVVPEKLKMQSLTKPNDLLPFANTKQMVQPNLLKANKAQNIQGTLNQNSLEQPEIKQGDATKPTLSVFSFNTKNNDISNFSMNTDKPIIHDLSKGSVSQTIDMQGLEIAKGNIGELNQKSVLQTKNIDTPIFEMPKENGNKKNYNVSQITIVKKQPLSLDEVKTNLNVDDKRVDTVLRKIDFSSLEKNQIKNANVQIQNSDVNIQNEKSTPSIQNQKSELGKQNQEINVVKSEAELKNDIKTNSTQGQNGEVKVKNDLTQTKNDLSQTKNDLTQTKPLQKENLQVTDNPKTETVTQDVKIEENGPKILDKKHQHVATQKEISKVETSTEEKNIELPKEVAVKGEVPIAPNKNISVKVKKGIKVANVRTEQENVPINNLQNQTRSEFDANPDLAGSNNSQTLSFAENNLELKHKPVGAFQSKLNGELVNAKEDLNIVPQEVRQENSERIVKSIEVIKEISRFISKQEKGTLSFKISPEHLGTMKITLDSSEQSITANIQVENEQAKQLVEKNIQDLQNQLKENGVEINSLNISLGNPESNKEQDGDESGKGNGQSEENSINETINEEEANRSLGYNTYEYLA
ncbi:MAG: hypothetical protein GY936_12385 [Ignavibacteriae bacterium]|nr:hypothetical protein [Ignavibacteriota bacterium]